MSDTIAITLQVKATDEANKVLYDKTLGGTVEQDVTHHGRFTVSAEAVDELHAFPDIPVLASAKQTFAVFLPGAEISVKVGASGNEARTVLEDVPVIFHDIADEGKFYFSTASTAAVSVEYFVGQVS